MIEQMLLLGFVVITRTSVGGPTKILGIISANHANIMAHVPDWNTTTTIHYRSHKKHFCYGYDKTLKQNEKTCKNIKRYLNTIQNFRFK